MSKLIEAYTGILTEIGLTITEEGSVMKKGSPHFVKGKPLVIPLASVLRSNSVQDKIVFHPLAESAAKGESDVLEDLRLRFANKINMNTARLMGFLLLLAVGEVKLALDPEQLKVMTALKGIDEKIAKDIRQIVENTTRGEGKKTPLVKIYLNRHPKVINGVKCTRNGVVTFPLYEAAKAELKSKDKGFKLLDVSISKKGLESLIRIFEYIYPGIESQENAYDVGSGNQIAPYADALFKTVGSLYAAINEAIKLFKDTAPIVEKIIMNDEWLDAVTDIDSLYREISLIPLQPNADGRSRVVDIEATQAQAAPMQQQQQGDVQVAQPPSMTLGQVQAPTAPVQSSGEPEWIIKPDGRRARNPKFLQPLTAGFAGMGGGNPMDAYAAPMLLPSSTVQLTQAQLIATPAGGFINNHEQSTVLVPYGASPPVGQINQPPMGYGSGFGY